MLLHQVPESSDWTGTVKETSQDIGKQTAMQPSDCIDGCKISWCIIYAVMSGECMIHQQYRSCCNMRREGVMCFHITESGYGLD